MVKVPNPFDGDVSDEAIIRWLNQFKLDERPIIEKLLANFRYYSFKKVNSLLRVLHAGVQNALQLPSEKVWFVPVGYVSKSGAAVAYFYRKQNNVPQHRFISTRDMLSVQLPNETAVVFLDDFIGSGHQATHVWQTIIEPNLSAVLPCPIVFGAIVGFEKGIEHLKANTKFRIVVADKISEADLPFSIQSKVFDDEGEKQRANAILQKYGEILYSRYPLGYAASQAILGFFYSTPNNTFPIFWVTKAEWHPLLPHGESFRDPEYLIGPPPGLTRGIASETPERPIIESTELDKYNIPVEMAVKVFSEFRSSPIFLILAPILRSLKIDETTFSAILHLISELKYAEHEKEAVCSSILIVPDRCDPDFLGEIFVDATPGLALADMPKVISFAHLVNGFFGAVIIKFNGEVVGNCLFKSENGNVDPFLPKRYRKAAVASLKAEGLLFLFGGNGRVSVFHDGNRILSHRGASWHLHTSELNRGIKSLSKEHSLDIKALQEVLRIAYRMSDEGLGALITVGDHENVLNISDPPKTGHFHWKSMHLGLTGDEVFIGLMSRDGATIVAKDGSIIQGMTFLRPPAGAKGEEEVGRGSKHSTAAKVSEVTNAVCVAVSVDDGRVTVYSKGHIAFKMMG